MFVSGSLEAYQGYNPAFVRRVREKRMQEEAASRERAKSEEQVRRELRKALREAAAEARRLEVEAAIEQVPDGETPKQIIARVARVHGLTFDDIVGASRSKHIVSARMDAVAAVKVAKPHLSLPFLGRLFGGRDHTTILHALRKRGVASAGKTGIPCPHCDARSSVILFVRDYSGGKKRNRKCVRCEQIFETVETVAA